MTLFSPTTMLSLFGQFFQPNGVFAPDATSDCYLAVVNISNSMVLMYSAPFFSKLELLFVSYFIFIQCNFNFVPIFNGTLLIQKQRIEAFYSCHLFGNVLLYDIARMYGNKNNLTYRCSKNLKFFIDFIHWQN